MAEKTPSETPAPGAQGSGDVVSPVGTSPAGEPRRGLWAQETYDFESFATQSLQKYGLVNVKIRPKITGAMVAKVYQMSDGHIYYDPKHLKFSYKDNDYAEPRDKINNLVWQRAVELVDKMISETGRFSNEYDVTVDLDPQVQMSLILIFDELESTRREKTLWEFFNTKVAYMLRTRKYRDIVAGHIKSLKYNKNLEEAKKALLEMAARMGEEDRNFYIQLLEGRVKELEKSSEKLESFINELQKLIKELEKELEELERSRSYLRYHLSW